VRFAGEIWIAALFAITIVIIAALTSGMMGPLEVAAWAAYIMFIATVDAILYVITERCERKARYVTFWAIVGTIGGTLSWMAMGVFLSVIVTGWSAAIAPLVLPVVIMMAAAAALIGLYFMVCWRTPRQQG
jgi:hypothetical protein